MNRSCPNSSITDPAKSEISILHITAYSTVWQKLIPWTVVVVQLLHKCGSEKSRSPSFICSRHHVQAQRPHLCPCSWAGSGNSARVERHGPHTQDTTEQCMLWGDVWGTKLHPRLLLLMWGICPFQVQHWITALRSASSHYGRIQDVECNFS